MKRIIALMITCVMLLSSVTAFASVPFTAEPIVVTYADNANSSGIVTVKGTYDKPLVLRVFNDAGEIVYIDTTDSSNGIFEFDSFELKKPALVDVPEKTDGITEAPYKVTKTSGNTTTTVYTIKYKFVLSDNTSIINSGTDEVTISYTTSVTTGGTIGGTSDTVKKDDDKGWDGDKKKEGTDADGKEPIDDASKDTLNIDKIEAASKIPTAAAGAKFIADTTKATSINSLTWESTRNTIAVSVETMMANIGAKKISAASSTNKLVLNEKSVSDADLKKYTDTEKTLNDAINKNKIMLNRELSKEYIINTTFSTTKKANITVYSKFVEKLEKLGINTLTINDKNFRVSYSITELKTMLGDKENVSFDIDTTAMTGTIKKLTVNFDTDKTTAVKISFPGLKGDSKYMAIVDENGNPVGGRYNPATGAIEAKIVASGEYQVVMNEKDFDDIKNKSEEMQESIKILAAKGIIEGTSEKSFSPDDTISRAEIAALLLRVLSRDDPNADGGFIDVKKSDWFYGTAGSAKAYGMIAGFEDNTFRGNAVIEKDQILTIASRVLQREMAYKTPTDVNEYLTYADSAQIADWAKDGVALATMANIVTRNENNLIESTEDITRGEAALIIMRLFYKIW